MIQAWVVFRLVKFLGLALLGGGVLGAAFSSSSADRIRAAYVVAPVGWLVTMISGYLLMKATGFSMSEPFIKNTLWASLVATSGAILAANRPGPIGAALAVGGLATSVGLMVARDVPALGLAIGVVVGGVGALLGRGPIQGDVDRVAATRRWFKTVARLEGASLILMLCISMPLRKLFDISLDGGQGWIGWTHGVLVLLFLQALVTAWRVLGWSLGRVALGFVASLIPFGTFVFEWRVLRDAPTEPGAA